MLKPSQAGFSMIELLIALVILSVGLLGTAGIQALGLRTASVALDHNTATQLAVEITERMRTNALAFEANSYDGSWDASSTLTRPTCSPCTSAQQAQIDLHDWMARVTQLNQGAASIASDGVTATVTLTWVDVTFGSLNSSGQNSGEEAQSFVLTARMN